MKSFFLLLAGLLAVTAPALAQEPHHHHPEKPIPSGSAAIRFLYSSEETAKSADPAVAPVVTWKFIAVWTSATPPTTFFYRPEGDRWMTCAIMRARGFVSQEATPAYSREAVNLKDLRRGDIIEITAVPNGRDLMPEAVKLKAVGLLYFQRKNNTAWETANPGKLHRIINMRM